MPISLLHFSSCLLIDYNSKSEQLYAKILESNPDKKKILQLLFSILNIGDTKILSCLLKYKRTHGLVCIDGQTIEWPKVNRQQDKQ
jgi:hypothetical protein